MAASFFQPGVECDTVAAGRTSDPWKTWCDCMFQPGSADWNRCVARACLLAWGCPNPSKGGANDLFNAHPGMLAAPWTDLGAAARSIPKRNASVAYTLTGATVINLNEWTPLNLWQQYWLNPAHYAVLLGQLSLALPLIPVAGPVIAAALRAAGAAPPVQLLPLASAEVAARKLDPVKAILEPTFKGSIKNIGTALSYLGNCGVGANIPCGAGLAVKRVAQDQIDTGRINNYDPATRAITVFLADKGDALVEALTKAITGGINRALATQVFNVLKSGFLAAKTVAQAVNDQAAAAVLTLLHKAAEVGYVIADGIEQRKTPESIADDVCDKLLGFRPSVFFNLLKANAQAAVSMVKSAQQSQGSGFEKAMEVVNAVSTGFTDIARVILDFERQLGASLGDLSAMFSNAAGALGGTRAAVEQMQQSVINAVPVAPQQTTLTSVPRPMLVVNTLPRNPSPSTPAGAKPMSAIPYFIGGAAGALLGGPVGGAVGVGAGALVAQLLRGGDGGPDLGPVTLVSVPKTSQPSPLTTLKMNRGLEIMSLRGFGDAASLRPGEARRLTATSAQGPAQMLTVVGRNGPVRVDARSYAAQRGFAPITGVQEQPTASRFPDMMAHARGYGFIGTKTSWLAPLPQAQPQSVPFMTAIKLQPKTSIAPPTEAMQLTVMRPKGITDSGSAVLGAELMRQRIEAAQKEAAAKEKEAAAAKVTEQMWAKVKMNTMTTTPEPPSVSVSREPPLVSRELPPTTREEPPPVMPMYPGTSESAPPVSVPQYLPRVSSVSGTTIALGLGAFGVAVFLLTRKKAAAGSAS